MGTLCIGSGSESGSVSSEAEVVIGDNVIGGVVDDAVEEIVELCVGWLSILMEELVVHASPTGMGVTSASVIGVGS